MSRRYDSSTTTFSPEGRLHQVCVCSNIPVFFVWGLIKLLSVSLCVRLSLSLSICCVDVVSEKWSLLFDDHYSVIRFWISIVYSITFTIWYNLKSPYPPPPFFSPRSNTPLKPLTMQVPVSVYWPVMGL